jgi:hypothetical protein
MHYGNMAEGKRKAHLGGCLLGNPDANSGQALMPPAIS